MAKRALPLLAALLLGSACSAGSYPVDIFPEMHYQPSHRPLEPERLAPPDEAVPRSGRTPRLSFPDARALQNPEAGSLATLAEAEGLYRVNCQMCHGSGGAGDGPMAPYYASGAAAVVPPVNLTGDRARARTDGQLWWLIREGIGNMPAFGRLLTERETWLLVAWIRERQR